MSVVKEYFYNVRCDCCGNLANEEMWSADESQAKEYTDNWMNIGGKDYCPDCWDFDDDDNIVTKDGRKFNGDTGEEILEKGK